MSLCRSSALRSFGCKLLDVHLHSVHLHSQVHRERAHARALSPSPSLFLSFFSRTGARGLCWITVLDVHLRMRTRCIHVCTHHIICARACTRTGARLLTRMGMHTRTRACACALSLSLTLSVGQALGVSRALQHLSVARNSICAPGATCFANALYGGHFVALESLGLRQNDIGRYVARCGSFVLLLPSRSRSSARSRCLFSLIFLSWIKM